MVISLSLLINQLILVGYCLLILFLPLGDTHLQRCLRHCPVSGSKASWNATRRAAVTLAHLGVAQLWDAPASRAVV